jgi:hypothetical protein
VVDPPVHGQRGDELGEPANFLGSILSNLFQPKFTQLGRI